jgi:hypothetical protein
MNQIGTPPALPLASTGWSGRTEKRKDKIMAHFNIDSLRSYAVAAVASVYCSAMLFMVAVGQTGAQVGQLVA